MLRMKKTDLRKEYIQKRKELDPFEAERLSSEIARRFEDITFAEARFVHLFYPIIGKHEVDSLLIRQYLSAKYPDIKFVLPKTNLTDFSLINIQWDVDTPLAMNQWGITEPERGEVISHQSIDAVIVPLLICDLHGNRIGYGKGFYDRFLSNCRPNVLKIGVNYFDPIHLISEVDPYDIPLDILVSPQKIWYFGQ